MKNSYYAKIKTIIDKTASFYRGHINFLSHHFFLKFLSPKNEMLVYITKMILKHLLGHLLYDYLLQEYSISVSSESNTPQPYSSEHE